jgi:membrane protease subunit (stomatin/prohibitin family)
MIGDYLRDVIVARITDLFGEKLDTIFDLPRIYDELAVEIKARLVGDFGKYGMELADFYLNSITPPPEVEKMIDERSGLEAVGNLDSFFKFKAAKAMGDAAAGGGSDGAGSAAASGMGIGVGAGLGFMMPGMIAQSARSQGTAVQETIECAKCRAAMPAEARFCGACGAPVARAECAKCRAALDTNAKFCPGCGTKVEGR